jgi:hypothetical protein
LGVDVAVKAVKIFNRIGSAVDYRISGAKVILVDNAGNYQETYQIGNAVGITEFDFPYGANPTGGPFLSDSCKTQLRAQFRKNMDIFDTSIALVFGNKTTIGQVCSFAKGLASKTVTNIPGFCCLDAPYQSKIEEWGEKVSSWGYEEERTLVM